MSKKIPKYLVSKNQLVGTIIFTVLFAIIFLNIYTPLSSTAWFDLAKPFYFFFTLGFISAATLILVVSRIIMYKTRKMFELTVVEYSLWIVGEIIVISIFYTFVTVNYINSDIEFLEVFPKAIAYTAIILIISYVIAIMYCAINDKNKKLRSFNEYDDSEDDNVVNLLDNNGVLRFSVKMDNLYYIESQDNYIKVNYYNKGAMCNYMIRCTLKTVEETFSDTSLIRCHRSYIVNSDKVKVLRKEKDGIYLDLDFEGIKEIPVSKGYSYSVLEYFSKK